VHVFGGLKQDTMWPIGGDTASEANSHRLSTARQFIWTTKVESDRSSGTAAERQQKRELSEEEELDDTRWHRGMGLGAEGEDGGNRWAAPPDESRNETPSLGAMMGAQAVDQRQEGRRRALLLEDERHDHWVQRRMASMEAAEALAAQNDEV
jgi:hypothetical protein